MKKTLLATVMAVLTGTAAFAQAPAYGEAGISWFRLVASYGVVSGYPDKQPILWIGLISYAPGAPGWTSSSYKVEFLTLGNSVLNTYYFNSAPYPSQFPSTALGAGAKYKVRVTNLTTSEVYEDTAYTVPRRELGVYVGRTRFTVYLARPTGWGTGSATLTIKDLTTNGIVVSRTFPYNSYGDTWEMTTLPPDTGNTATEFGTSLVPGREYLYTVTVGGNTTSGTEKTVTHLKGDQP